MLEIGDKVKVLDPGELRNYYKGGWAPLMEKYIGTIQTIQSKDTFYGSVHFKNVIFKDVLFTWMPEHLQKVEETKMSDYTWQPGDYVLTEELSWEDYIKIGSLWVTQGVEVGEFPDRVDFRNHSRFGVQSVCGLFHGNGSELLRGRRVQLIDGEIQVVEDADKGINASVVKAVAEDAFNAGYAASLQSERHHQVRYLLKKHGVV